MAGNRSKLEIEPNRRTRAHVAQALSARMTCGEQPAAGEPGLSPAGRPLMARRKGLRLSSTTQRVLRRSQNGEEGDTLRRRDLRESERGGRKKPHTWQPARLKIVFLKFAIVVLDRNHSRSRRRYRRGDLDASLGHELDADLRATHERCGQPRECCDDRKATHPARIRPAARSRPFLHGRNYAPQMTVF